MKIAKIHNGGCNYEVCPQFKLLLDCEVIKTKNSLNQSLLDVETKGLVEI